MDLKTILLEDPRNQAERTENILICNLYMTIKKDPDAQRAAIKLVEHYRAEERALYKDTLNAVKTV